jgi:predicted AAA+ superfamily ATPase
MYTMWKRAAVRDLKAMAEKFPAILLLGARQVGKTTLARATFPKIPYCDLERPDMRELFSKDPRFQIQNRTHQGLILDEAQAVPEVFSALRGLIDEDRQANGRYIILGSAQPALVRGASESLAGRVGILELDPLTAGEIARGPDARPWTDAWLRGGFPDAVKRDFRTWWESFLRTYVERDLPALGVAADPIFLRRLLTMLAHAQGGICNASNLGASLGVSYHTIQRHLDILERTFLVRRLQPYFRNVGKRLVKSPKVYLRDTGLLHHLLNLATLDEVSNHPIKGASWETFVIEDIIRRERRARPHTQFYFWRTSIGVEVDLVLDRGSTRIAIEVKSGRGGRPETIRQLQTASADLGASSAWILDEDEGTDPLGPKLRRRGFASDLDWLP